MICFSGMLLSFQSTKFSEKVKAGIATGILLTTFIFILVKTKQGIPVFDEYTSIFEFLCKYQDANSTREKFSLILQPYFECRIPVPYSIILIFSFLSGPTLPLNLIISLNAVVLLVIALLLFQSMTEFKFPMTYIPWFLLFIFHTQFLQSSFNSLSGLCYNGVILFTLLALRSFALNTNRGRLLALLFAILGMLTFGNGLLIIPLLFLQSLRFRGFKVSIVYIVPLIIVAILYFSNYHPHVTGKESASLFALLYYVPVFLGSAFQFFYASHLPFIIGICILSLYTYASVKRYDLKNPLLYYGLGFIILTAIITSGFRATITVEAAMKLRYGLFSSFALLMAILISLELFHKKINQHVLRRVAIAAVVYNLMAANFFYPESVLTIKHNIMMLETWKSGAAIVTPSAYYPGGLEPVLECSFEDELWRIDHFND